MKKLLPLLLFPLLSYGQIAQDKQKHFIVGAGISAVTYEITYTKTGNRSKAILYSVLSSAIIGTAKEIADSRNGRTGFDTKDLAATVGGGIAGTVVIDIFANKKPRRFRRGL